MSKTEKNSKAKEPKISVLVPVYNTEQFLEKSLKSILGQTYRSIEIVVVSDASTGNVKEIIENYQKEIQEGRYKGKTIKYIEHEKNRGLYHTRLTAYENATGEYIGIVDSDDYIAPDFYRLLINRAINSSSDIVFSETIFNLQDSRKIVHPMADNLNFEVLYGKECINFLLEQEGRNFLYHVVWNKIYTKKIWDKAVLYLQQQPNHLIMCEDILFSSVLWFFAEKVTKTKNAYYYIENNISATSKNNLTYKKINKNLSDIYLVFVFVSDFFEKVKYSSHESKQHLLSWKQHIAEVWNHIILFSSVQKKNNLFGFLKREIGYEPNKQNRRADFFKTAIDFDYRFEELKESIISQNCEYVSFDLFDTLVWRPFYTPTDLFSLIDPYFKTLVPGAVLIKFADARINAESVARYVYDNKQEISLDEIYGQLQKILNLSDSVTQQLKEKEIEYEIKYCFRRDSAFELFELSEYLGKKIFITSDMYLPKSVIEEILLKNGYTKYTELFLSSEQNKTKHCGDLYEHFLKKYNITPKKVVHIGDNFHSDFNVAKNKGIKAIHFPRAVDVFMGKENMTKTNCLGSIFEKNLPFWQDMTTGLGYIGVRSFLSLAANKYFDNPFRSFDQRTDFNSDPTLLGYYAVGMQNFAQLMWLRKKVLDGGYDNLVFVARDGFLLKQTWDLIFKDNEKIKSHYLPTSRKAIVPLVMNNFSDAHVLGKFININIYKPVDIVKYFKNILTDSISIEETFRKNKISSNKILTTDNQYNAFIKVLYEELISIQKVEKLRSLFKQTYNDMFTGKTCIYDIGYSGKPEALFSNIFNKNIDVFFAYTNSDEGQTYINSLGGNLETFYNFRPVNGGGLREMFISELGPSCVGYTVREDKLITVFGEKTVDCYQKTNIEIIQKQAIQFVKEVFNIYGDDLKLLYYTDYYLSVPFEMFVQSAKDVDKNIFRDIPFEDEIGSKYKFKDIVNDFWNPILSMRNQREIESIEYFSGGVDISRRNIFVKGIYYILFNKHQIVWIIANKLRGHPYLYARAKRFYFLLRKIRQSFYRR